MMPAFPGQKGPTLYFNRKMLDKFWREDYPTVQSGINLFNIRSQIKNMQRPTSVTVFGILNIVFALLGIFGVAASLLLFAAVGTNSNNPVIQIIQDNPSYAAYLKFSIVVGVVVALILLATGIGLLMLKPWARVISIIYGVYAIFSVIGNTIANYYFVTKPLLEKAQTEQGPEAARAVGGAIGGMLGGCFGLIYPILLLIFMMRPKVAAAFNPSSTDGTQPPPLPRS
jgi:hypothetical protein